MRITLRMKKHDPTKAAFMLSCAQWFATEKAGGPPGPGHGTAYSSHGGHVCYAYWTKARAVVVVEQTNVESR